MACSWTVTPEDEGTTIYRNVANNEPNETESHPKKVEYSKNSGSATEDFSQIS